MLCWLTLLLSLAAASLKSRENLLLENLALRHQLLVLTRNPSRPRLNFLDRAFWAWVSRSWSGWRIRLRFVQPDTVIRWHREGFRFFWKWKSRRRTKAGRKTIAPATVSLIRDMSRANPLWGAPQSLAKIPSRLKTLGFHDISRDLLPHDLLVDRPDSCGSCRIESPSEPASGEPGFAPPNVGPAPEFHPTAADCNRPRSLGVAFPGLG
jgi:hypothetical protein